MSHDQPTYASVPGIRVYGMMCVQGNRRGRPLRYSRSVSGMHSKSQYRFLFRISQMQRISQLICMFDMLNRTCTGRGETTLPLGQGTTADGDVVSLGIVSRRDVPPRICHRRIYALIYNAIFIILPAIRIPCSNSLHPLIISLLLLSRFLNSRTGTRGVN